MAVTRGGRDPWPVALPAVLSARNVSRSRGGQVILDGVSLSAGPGTRLGVVGPNGIGKSTLLRILAGLEAPDRGAVERSPASLRVGYLAQEPDAYPGETLLAYLARRTGVAAASVELDRATEALSGAAEVSGTPGAPSSATEALTGAAEVRSGAASAPSSGEAGAIGAHSESLERFMALGGDDFDARAAVTCAEVGLSGDRLAAVVGELSGGQAARAGLAAILLSRFDVFFLDEPTNDLDFAGLDRLEGFIAGVKGAVVVVSHDRAFLDRSVGRILEIDDHSHAAVEYAGAWSEYVERRSLDRTHHREQYQAWLGERRRLVERVRTQRSWSEHGVKRAARKPRDHDRAQRGFFVNRTEKQASKVRISERALGRLGTLDKPWEGWQLNLELTGSGRSGDVVARLDGATVERGSFRLGPVDVQVDWQDRVAVTGPNGGGKSTLLAALAGHVRLSAGTRFVGPGVVIGELDQRRRRLDVAPTLLDGIAADTGLVPEEARSLLAKFGLGADHVGRHSTQLSPGERTRAQLAAVMGRRVNCLVLDEPTNHLDLPAIEALEAALESYDGTLLVVTHDRWLLETVSLTRTLHVAGGRVAEEA